VSFPSTSILDTFNRANEGPPPSTNWSGPITSGGGWSVVSNKCKSAGVGDPSDYWNTSFAHGQECYVTVDDFQSASVMLYARISNPPLATLNAYLAIFSFGAGALGTIRVYKYVAGAATQLGTDVNGPVVNGDSLGLEVTGSTINVWQNSGGGWGIVDTHTDSDVSAGGYIGIEGSAANIILDSFGGGEIAVPTSAGAGRISAVWNKEYRYAQYNTLEWFDYRPTIVGPSRNPRMRPLFMAND
jgi:hypothetical protein